MNRSLLGFILFILSTAVFAEQSQSLDLLRSKIEAYVLNELSSYSEGKIQVTADKIDSRLNLKACSEEKLNIFNPYQTTMLNTNTMGIKCLEEDNHWTLYVPIKITVLKTVWVAKRPLVAGNRINPNDIYQTEMDAQKLKQGYFTAENDLTGLVCKQNIPQDTPITPYNIELAKLVHRGEQVTIIASNGNLTITMSGVSVDDGALGETVKVKNLTSKRIVEAQVTDLKKVKVSI